MKRAHRTSRGFSIITAIFLVVVLASLGTIAVVISGVQQGSARLGLQSARAYYAARSGLEWASYQAVVNGSCPASATFNLTETSLSGFQVTAQCAATNHVITGNPTVVYDVINVTSQTGVYGGRDFVSRQLQAKLAAP